MRELEFSLNFPSEAQGAHRAPGAGGAANNASFAKDLGHAIDAVDKLQLDADKEADRVAQGAGNLHEVALALEKADVAMRLAVKVRNKVVDAYTEIMRMSI